jgi:hypothetical protein
MTRSDIAPRRLRSQRISADPLREPEEVVRWLAAVQAQDYAGAKWALGLRMQTATDRAIDQAFAEGSILRTHLMRPTWHFVTPADIRWMLALTAPRVHTANAPMYRQLALDSAVFERSSAALRESLGGGIQLTREELRDALRNAGIADVGGLRLAYILMAAELDGVVCSGARRGKQFTYALLEERVPAAEILGREEALAELAQRYFQSRGPATVQDFAKWSGLTLSDARRGLESVKARLEQERLDGHAYWFAPSRSAGKDEVPTGYLLSIYDEYVSGYRDRSAIGDAEVGARLKALGNDLTSILVVGGQIAGTWKRTLGKDAVVIKTDLFTQLSDAENRSVCLAARRYGAFLELPVVFPQL